MGFSIDAGIPAFTVFLQGLFSFFSPCVLPLLPLYISYLSGGTGVRGEDGRMRYQQKKVAFHTICFVAGVSFAFFLLGLGMSAVGAFFHEHQAGAVRIGGILIIGFGLYQLGVFGSSQVLGREYRLPFLADAMAMSPITAFLMGFTFSFAWTPCVGPALTSVLLMAASASTKLKGFVLIGVYTLGFVLPFLAVGFFTTSLLELFKRYRNLVRYTVKAGGILLILMGILMFTGKMNQVSGYLSGLSQTMPSRHEEAGYNGGQEEGTGINEEYNGGQGGRTGNDEGYNGGQEEGTGINEEYNGGQEKGTGNIKEQGEAGDSGEQKEAGNREGRGESTENGERANTENDQFPPAVDFALSDQYGNIHTLADYKGKTIFLNFWATWCPPCRAEMPDIQKLHETYEQEGEDALIVLGVAAPQLGQEGTEEEIKAFLEENGYTYPVLMDTTGELFFSYGIQAFPTTFMIDRDGKVFGYISGQLTMEMMEDIIRQTMEGKRR